MAEFLLFDANPDNEAQLTRSGYRHIIAAVSARDEEERTLFTTKIANCGTGASLYRENTVFHANENLDMRKAVTARLDTLVAKNKLNHAQLIKIDVQGAELDVLNGGSSVIGQADYVLIAEIVEVERFEQQGSEHVQRLADELAHLISNRGMLVVRPVL